MGRTLPTALLCTLLLSACQGASDEQHAVRPAAVPDGACSDQSRSTIVRYRATQPTDVEHAVHLLNGPEQPAAEGCPDAMPIASVVTLRYRIAGS